MEHISKVISNKQPVKINQKATSNDGKISAQTLTKDEGNFLKCLTSARISKSHDSHIVAVLKFAAVQLGMKIEKMGEEMLIAMHVQNIRDNHSTLTIAELKLAFDMAAALKLDFNPHTYQNFSPLYVNELLSAYKRWAATTYRFLRPGGDPQDEKEQSDYSFRIYRRLPDDELRAEIQQGYVNFLSGIITHRMYIPYEWWAQLVEDGYIEHDVNATVFDNCRVSELTADQKQCLKNGQEMVWLLFELAKVQQITELYKPA